MTTLTELNSVCVCVCVCVCVGGGGGGGGGEQGTGGVKYVFRYITV